jgi:erythromycin esterase
MSHPVPAHATLDEWIAREAIPFSLESPASFHAAVDNLLASLGDVVDVLAFGEPLHGSADPLVLRNQFFKRLVEAHGYCAIAMESSFSKGRLANDYICGEGPTSYEAIQDAGFSHGFGKPDANRELVEWMRQYNADPTHRTKLHFYGFDSPTEMVGTDSPRQLLHVVLDYLAAIDGAANADAPSMRRQRIDELIGQDADWENPAASFDPTKGIGLSPAAGALRIETEDLITHLRLRRPELVAKSDAARYAEAAHYASAARELLNYHAGIAGTSPNRIAELLGIRDCIMADNLAYISAREQSRGKVLAFAHNSHLQRSMARWQLGDNALAWWPAGAHLDEMLGPRYAAIGAAVVASDAQGIGQPELGTIEAQLAASLEAQRGSAPSATALFIPTRRGQGLPAAELAALPTRSSSPKNPGYFPLTSQSIADFDALLALQTIT